MTAPPRPGTPGADAANVARADLSGGEARTPAVLEHAGAPVDGGESAYVASAVLPEASFAERAVGRITRAVQRRGLSRRSLLSRAAVVGSAIAVNPTDFLFRPNSAYATVCGSQSLCTQGYTAFCCTINDGANTCPDRSYVAGWWKVDGSAFCNGSARYYIDCNDDPGYRRGCGCASGTCDERRISCNNFRYGQCNTQVPGVTPVTCRIVTCTPPWIWDPSCSTSVRTDANTRTHSAPCLPGENPTEIQLRYLDLGLAGSVLGRRTVAERSLPALGPDAAREDYEDGILVHTASGGTSFVRGRAAVEAYDAAGGPSGDLGPPVDDTRTLAGGRETSLRNGRLYTVDDTAVVVPASGILTAYLDAGGPAGDLGFPASAVESRSGEWRVLPTLGGWLVVRQGSSGEVRILPDDVDLPADGSWPVQTIVDRLAGDDRYETAIALAQASYPTTAEVVFLGEGGDFPDSLVAGAPAALRPGPLLLTRSDELLAAVRAELRRLTPATVVMLGGPAALSLRVAELVRDALPDATVERLAGDDRYATAAAVARRFAPQLAPRAGGAQQNAVGRVVSRQADDPERTVLVATGVGFADALASVPFAEGRQALTLLTRPERIPGATRQAFADLQPDVAIIVGGTAAVSEDVERELRGYVGRVDRVSGPDRFATAVALAPGGAGGPDADLEVVGGTVVIASGRDFPDGLAAGPFAAQLDAPLLLTDTDRVPDAVDAHLRKRRPERIVVVGGSRVVSESVVTQLRRYVAERPPVDPMVVEPDTGAAGTD